MICYLFGIVPQSFSQANTTNFSFSATTNGTLTNMTSGTTTLIGPDVDGLNTGTFSIANDIGFTFYFMGSAYTQFVATEDGVIRLGSSLTPINRVPELTVNEPRIIPFACDMRTGSNGKVHYKVTGSAPNRVFTIEWKNMIIAYPLESQSGNSTFQLRLYESSNIIEYIYGYMYVSIYGTNYTSPPSDDYGNIGFTNGNAANSMIYKTNSFISNTVDYGPTPSDLLKTSITGTGEVSGLSSTSDGYRMLYRFTPISAPAAPTNISFSSIGYSSITVNWTDNSSNEAYFIVSRSEDGGTTYEQVAKVNAGITTAAISGLPSKTYTFKIEAVNEGGISSPLTGSCSTLAAGEIVSNTASGMWSDPSSWSPATVPSSTDNVTIKDGQTITIDVTSAVCNNLTVGEGSGGTLQFIGGTTSATLTVDGNVTVNTGGTFTITPGATSGARKLVIGNRQRANANLVVNGTFDMNRGGSSNADVEFRGSSNGTISGSGSTCDFYSITLNKGSDYTPTIEVTREITISQPNSSANRLTITNGTFKLSSASSLAPYYGSQTIVSSTGQLWLNNSMATISCANAGTSATGAGNATITSGGILRITSGSFKYGAGANTLSVGGTLKLESSQANLYQYGKLYIPNSGYLIMSDGNIAINPQTAVASLNDNVVEFGSTAFALVTGGAITIVNPTSSSNPCFYIPSAGEQNKSFIGSTLKLGDSSGSFSGSSDGFYISVPTHYKLSLGNIEVNNPSGSNRQVSMLKSDGNSNNFMIQNLTITAGSFCLYNTSSTAYTIDVYGNIVNSGTLNASVANNELRMCGSSAQTISGSGSISSTNRLVLEMNNNYGVSLQSPLTVYKLVLTTGKLTTTSTNILTILPNTSTGSGNSKSYVNGPLKRIIPNGTNTITFPVGKGTYNMLELVSAVTTSNTVEFIAEVNDENCGGSYSNDPYILNSNRYWNLQLSANSSNFTSSYIRVTEVGTTTGQLLTYCSTKSGTYSTFSNSGGASGYTILSNSTITNTNISCYFAIASNYLAGNYNVGSGQAYTSLTGATGGLFTAINSSGLRGDVTAYITSDITETGEIELNQWNEANGSGYKLTIESSAAALRTLSGSVYTTDAGGPGAMIRINGADSVIFDGTVNQYLSFKNNTTVASQTSPTFEILNGTVGFKLLNSVIENHNNSVSTQGTITLGSGTNSNITISGNDIRNATTGTLKYPYCAIYSNNSGNSDITISDNNIYNFGNYGIDLATVGDNISITGNNLYKTLTDDLSSISQTGIYLSGGNGHTISDNYIGGQDIHCGGSAWTHNDGSSVIQGLVINVANVSPTSVQNNTISNFDVQGTSGDSFVAIKLVDGSINLGTVTGNTIATITSGAQNVFGIESSANTSILIMNSDINNLTATGTGSSTVLKGIIHSANSAANIGNNSIYNLSCYGTSTSLNNQTVTGIYYSGASVQPTIKNNTIYNLEASNSSAVQTNASGILINSAISPRIEKNKIYQVKNASTLTTASTPPTASGVVLYNPGTGAEISNNTITLGHAESTNTEFNGIWMNHQPDATSTIDILYNSVVISGAVASGALPSFALLRGDNAGTSITNFTLYCRNNLFANSRNGGTGKHYVFGNTVSSPSNGWNSTSSNFNLLAGTISSTLGLWNSADCNYNNWKSSTSCDQNSFAMITATGNSNADTLNLTNLFTDIATGNLNPIITSQECWALNGKGIQLSNINSDFIENSRSTQVSSGSTDIGAFEFTPSSIPFVADQSGSIGDGLSTDFSYGGRTIGSITWHGTDFPVVNMRFYTGTNPTDDADHTLAGTTYSNVYWNISATGGNINNFTYDLTLYYDDNMLGSVSDESILNIIKNPVIYPLPTSPVSNLWGTYKASSRNNTTNTVTISDIIGFSDFALEAGMIPLPVKLINFTALPVNGMVELTWETASETNNDYFSVEKSMDLNSWTSLSPVQGAGNSNKVVSYHQSDEHPFAGRSYYRLKQTDFDGKTTYSEIKTVMISVINDSYLNCYFEETCQQLVIENKINNEIEANVEVFNYVPVKCHTKQMQLAKGYNAIDLSLLPSGIYIVLIRTENGTITSRFVKQ